MKLLEKIRNHIYWSVQYIKRSEVKSHYNQIKYINENYNSEESKIIIEKNLNKLLHHALATVPFYKAMSGLESLKDFPVINKNTITSDIKYFASETYNNKKLKHVYTSGSTGAPFKVSQNRSKVERNTADNIYFSNQVGFDIGHKLYYARHWTRVLKKNKFIAWAQNIVQVEVQDFNDEYIKKLIKDIERSNSTKGFLGHSSALEMICKYLDKTKAEPINSNVKSIIAMSERLNDYTKKTMQKYFNCPTVSRYSNTENGLFAMQNTKWKKDTFDINWSSYIIEVLKFDEDTPAKPNEAGRIVITDFFNYAMPLIRYDTGDVGVLDNSVSPPVFSSIEGRKLDIILNTKGEIVSSFLFYIAFKFDAINQTQFIQEEKNLYTLKLNIEPNFNSEKEIIKELKFILGDDAIINVEYVDNIPLLSSGKMKLTINNFIK